MSTQNRSHKKASPASLKTYIVQARFVDKAGAILMDGKLSPMGEYLAQSHTGAIVQAGNALARMRENASEIVATLKG